MFPTPPPPHPQIPLSQCLTTYYSFFPRFSLFHLEHQPQTGKGLTKLLGKHYRNQALFELHTLIFGLDVLGNPVSIVRGVVFGAKDLFYEPFKVQSEYLLSIYRLNCFVCLFVCLSVCLSVCLPVYLSVCLFVWM